MKIPISNFYFLLVYTWGLVRESEVIRKQIGSHSIDFPLDMLAELLLVGLKDQLRKGLDRDYIDVQEVTGNLRGKINVAESVKQNTFIHSKLHCEYSDLSHDVIQNQVLKSVLRRVHRSNAISRRLKDDTRDVLVLLHDVSDINVSRRDFHDILIHRNNRQYRLLLNIAQMIFDSLLPDPTGSRFEFVELPEERKADIFEGFVRNYLARNLNGYTVKERRFSWSDTSATDEALAMLPSMRADVVVDTASTRRVIEVKFYEESLRTGHHGSAKKLISGHLYQLFAYLQNLKVNEDREISGVLLYAMAGDEFDLEYLVHGMPVRATSLDLTQSPEEIGARVTQIATSRFNIP